MNKILITGGAGFIGSHLSEKYLSDGYEVYILDDLSTGTLDNITSLEEEYKDHVFVTIDTVLNKEVLEPLIKKCDVIIHFAAGVGVKKILDEPLASMEINILGTHLVLGLCHKHNKRVLIASSSEVYGLQTKDELNEDDNLIIGPSSKLRWAYATSKLLDEFLALAYWREHKLSVTTVRFFNVVGPRQTSLFGMVMPTLVKQALNNEVVTVFGDGSQTRTFTHVEDACNCVSKLLDTDKALGEVVNIGGTEEISMLCLAEKIIQKTNSVSRIELIPYDRVYNKDFADMPRRVPCTKKLQRVLGENNIKKDLDTIIEDVVIWLENVHEKDR